ncbi:hypothetical protein BC628DRAFT_1392200 [Trametes gibbosa]|nr:hypothetical protein BC628DRAFT_1392200 [Trametes gibbosa]
MMSTPPPRGRDGGRGARTWRGRRGGWPPPSPRAESGARETVPQHRVYQAGKRHMELIPSVSRSSGLDKDGDALRDPKIQEEYRAFIQTKLDNYWVKHSPRTPPVPCDSELESRQHKKEMEGNLLILFRKLREGLLSTQRRDAFALEVYETSLHLSVLFASQAQTTSTLSHLFPTFYVSSVQSGTQPYSTSSGSSNVPPPDASTQSSPSPPPTALGSTLIFLLHHLVSFYPSQRSFYAELRQLHPTLQHLLRAPVSTSGPDSSSSTPQTEPASQPADRPRRPAAASSMNPHGWLSALARCLRRRDYARLKATTERDAFSRFVGEHPRLGGSPDAANLNFALEAIQVLVNSLVEKARRQAWNVLRTAYREVDLRATPKGACLGDTTAAWLARSLVLCTTAREEDARPSEPYDAVAMWFEERCTNGETRKKEGEGVEGRWILVKA